MKKNRVLYAITLLLAVMFVLAVRDPVAFVLLYAVLMLPFMSFVMVFLSRFLLKIKQGLNSNLVIKGGTTQYFLILHNKSFLHLHSVKVWFSRPAFGVGCNMKDQVFSVAPFEQKSVLFEIECHCRGVYELSVDVVELIDFLGLFKIRRNMNNKEQLVVYPRVNEFFEMPLTLSLQVKAESSKGSPLEDMVDIADMRQYRPSDSLRKIHWKLTAKRQELIVKNYHAPTTSTVTIFLDQNLFRHNLSKWSEEERVLLEDKMVEGCVSALHSLLQNEQPVEFLYGLTELIKQKAHDITVFEMFYEIIANLECRGKNDPALWLSDYIYQQNENLNMLLFTAGLQRNFFEVLLLAQKLGHNTMTYYFSPDNQVDNFIIEDCKEHALNYELITP